LCVRGALQVRKAAHFNSFIIFYCFCLKPMLFGEIRALVT